MQGQPLVIRSFQRALLGNAQRLGAQASCLLRASKTMLACVVSKAAEEKATAAPTAWPANMLKTEQIRCHAGEHRCARSRSRQGCPRSQGFALLVVLLFLFVGVRAQEVQTLSPDKTIEREISGGQIHTYAIALKAGQFVHFDVQQTSCDVALTWTAPDGKKLDANVTPFGLPETLSAEVATTGEYQLTVRSLDFPKMTGTYRLQIAAKPAAETNDKKRLQAEQLLVELRGNLPPTQRLEKAQQLLTLWRELGERFWEGNANVQIANVYSEQQNWAKAIEHTEIAMRVMRELNLRAGEAFYLSSLSLYQKFLRQTDKAIASAQQALTMAEEIKNRRLVAIILANLGDFHFSQGKYDQTVRFYERASALWLEMGNTAREMDLYNVKAAIARAQKNYAEAQKHYEAALAFAQERKNQFAQIQIYDGLGDLASMQQQNDTAIRYYEQALSVARAIGNRQRELDELIKLARHYKYKGSVPDKNRLYLAALPLARELNQLSTLSSIYGDLGDGAENFEKRLDYYQQGLEVARQANDKANQADHLQGICLTHVDMGNVEKAIPFCEQSLPLAREVGYRGAELGALRHLGDAYAKLFQYEKALSYFQETLSTAQKYDRQMGGAGAYAALASLYVFLGQYDKAQEAIEKALLIPAIKRTSNEFLCLKLLGEIYLARKQPEKALEPHEKLLAFMKDWAPDSMGVAKAQMNLGRDYIELGQYDKAQTYFEMARQLLVRVNEPMFLSWVQLGMGDSWHGLKLYDKAIASHQQALLLSRQYPTGTPYEAPYHEQLMKDWKALGNPALAIFFGKQAVNANQDVRFNLRNLEKDIQQSFLKSKEQTYRELADLLISQGRLPEAEQVIRMLKEEEYFEYIRRDDKNAPRTEKAALTPAEAALDKRYREIADSLTALGSERNALLEKKERTAAEEQRLDKLEADLKVAAQVFQKFLDQLSTELRAQKGTETSVVQINDSQAFMDDLRELGKGTVALYTLVTDDRFHVILTTSDVRRSYSYAIKAAELNRKVLAFREALQNPRLDPLPLAQELYKIIVAPLAKDLQAANAKTLMWSLDGVLRYMPIAALHDGEKYLVERWRNVVFTTASKARLKDEPNRKWNALGLGVTKAHGDRIPALPAVAEEMRGIIREAGSQTGVLPGTIKLDEQFTQTAMLTGLRSRPPVVHVASHFQFKPGNETDSALLLGDGNFLSLAQIKTMTSVFSGVELLTLSACNTATGGSGADGKEVEGFGMLAQQQGAKAVVASLWPVADRSTKELMRAFYQLREAKAGTTKADALRQAQMRLMSGELVMTMDLTQREIVHERDTTTKLPPFKADAKKPYAHPYYWAPFILIGNWK